jgi:hypothetical protein
MQWEVVIAPEQEALYRALSGLPLSNRLILQAASRLTEPPKSLSLPAPERTQIANEVIHELVGFDGDMAARTLRLSEGQPDPEATWGALTLAERKRAKRRWNWACDAALDVAPQGRPSRVDSALVLYCMRVLAETCGHSRFKFSRPTDGGTPTGPGWRALMAALPLAASHLARVDSLSESSLQIAWAAETVADIVTVARSKSFAKLSKQLNLGPRSDDVADRPGTFRYAVSITRRPRHQAKRRSSLP